MKTICDIIIEKNKSKKDNPCWKGYKMVGHKKKNGKKVPNCVKEGIEYGMYKERMVPLEQPMLSMINEKDGKELNKPRRGGPKKYYVYVKNDKGNVIKVSFGDPNSSVKINNKKRRDSFVARHKCDQVKDKTKPSYWSCNLPRYADELGLKGGGDFYW